MNLQSEKSSAEEVETKKDITVINASLKFKCDKCSHENSYEKGLRHHRKKKHKSLQADGADKHIEQLDGNISLPLDSPTNRSAKVKETTDDDMSRVTSHVSRVTCHIFFCFCFFLTKWWSSSVEGLLSRGPTPSFSRKDR